MAEIIWVGPGWYKLLSFAVGNKKIVQVSQNKEANVDDSCYWCESMLHCAQQFEEGRNTIKSKRIMY